MSKKPYYITTAITYTSGKPHIGNTYEIILADSIARYKRMEGYDVFFQTGTDEHGQKEELKAEEDAEKDKKIQALEHEIMVNNSKNDAIKKLDEAGLPVKLADIINYSTKETAEASLDHIIKTYSECLENGIKEKLKGKTPEGLHSNAAINDMQDKQNKMRKYMGIK